MAEFPTDSILLPLLEGTKAQRESFLSELISAHAEPVIKKIVYYRLRVFGNSSASKESWDAEDVCGNAIMQVLSQLSKFSDAPDQYPIRDFRGYTAVVAHHACNQYFRSKYPKRTQLGNKLRYLLNHHSDFSTWLVENRLICGLSAWKNKPANAITQESGNLLVALRGKETEEATPQKLALLLKNVFESLKHPLFFDDLISLMIDMLELREQRIVPDKEDSTLEQIKDQRGNIVLEVEHRFYLKKLWNEMTALPLRQRIALLLSMRDHDGNSVLYLLPVTGTASIHKIAECLQFSAEVLANLWEKLPLDDNEIASRLEVTRQQVINLRRSARERLIRRMKS
jgi:DNA-directed RNA polymerase specialized sigma24 family protein